MENTESTKLKIVELMTNYSKYVHNIYLLYLLL